MSTFRQYLEATKETGVSSPKLLKAKRQALFSAASSAGLDKIGSKIQVDKEHIKNAVFEGLAEYDFIKYDAKTQNLIDVNEIGDVIKKMYFVWYSDENTSEESINWIRKNSDKTFIECADESGISLIYAVNNSDSKNPLFKEGSIAIGDIYHFTANEAIKRIENRS